MSVVRWNFISKYHINAVWIAFYINPLIILQKLENNKNSFEKQLARKIHKFVDKKYGICGGHFRF